MMPVVSGFIDTLVTTQRIVSSLLLSARVPCTATAVLLLLPNFGEV